MHFQLNGPDPSNQFDYILPKVLAVKTIYTNTLLETSNTPATTSNVANKKSLNIFYQAQPGIKTVGVVI